VWTILLLKFWIGFYNLKNYKWLYGFKRALGFFLFILLTKLNFMVFLEHCLIGGFEGLVFEELCSSSNTFCSFLTKLTKMPQRELTHAGFFHPYSSVYLQRDLIHAEVFSKVWLRMSKTCWEKSRIRFQMSKAKP